MLELFQNHPKIKELERIIEFNNKVQLVNLKTSAFHLFTGTFYKKNQKNLVVILDTYEEAAYFYSDLSDKIKEGLLFFPTSFKKLTDSSLKADLTNISSRLEALSNISEGNKFLLITHASALAEYIHYNNKQKTNIKLSVGQSIKMQILIDNLKNFGYVKSDFVYQPGQFSIRGSIIDIFPFTNSKPVRIDFLGDEIDSIRIFSIETQLSEEKISEIKILSNFNLYNEKKTLFEILPENTIIFFKNLDYISQEINDLFENTKEIEYFDDFSQKNIKIQFAPAVEIFSNIEKFKQIIVNNLTLQLPKIIFSIEAHGKLQKNFELLAEQIYQKQQNGLKTYIVSKSAVQLERLKDILKSSQVKRKVNFIPIQSNIYEGFTDTDLKIAVFTDHEIFGRYYGFQLKNYSIPLSRELQLLKELKELKVGDYVVHIDHGIGIFKGITQIENNGVRQEVVRIDYDEGGVVFVNLYGLHKISKYKSDDNTPPKIHKLGSAAWALSKEKTKKRIKDIAKDLIKLYAERMQSKGFSFSPDNELLEALEASFIYEETPDQLKAIEDVKKDMEKPVPMDRLICGDVGFGKTEIAIRAAFKAALDGKQVAILCPTTILAYQHFLTFSQRLKDFPVTVDYLSRLKSVSEQKKTLKNLESGKIDIIIGTHMLLGKNIKFKDLGLLIIDEEQKFGVAAKEKLRQLRTNVDTITMTATPIPRTLQFSLMGARDLSILQTPPPNRQPIQTEIHNFDKKLIHNAIINELKRGGQVFFVHNDIKSLPSMKILLEEIVPEATIEIAHGQMQPEKTENTITRFMNGEFDVLLTTSIIENGLDIPNANTIIINNAHKFGLSDLHQLRGRVGRSSVKAYCYLIIPPKHTLNKNAIRRLETIEKFVELGSGFSIALEDLDIRGAGDLLGAEQSGFINNIGFDAFKKILQEAIIELKENEYKDVLINSEFEELGFVADCQISTDLNLKFPSHYIESETERLRLYRILNNFDNLEDVESFSKQLIDRFGPIPHEAQELINIVKLRIIAKKLAIDKIVFKDKTLTCYFLADKNSPFYDSEIFTNRIIGFVMKNKNCEFREKNERLYLKFFNVNDISEALKIISSI